MRITGCLMIMTIVILGIRAVSLLLIHAWQLICRIIIVFGLWEWNFVFIKQSRQRTDMFSK